MFNLSGGEITFILILGLVVLGPEKLPDAIRRGGRLYAELKKMSTVVQGDLKKVIDEPLREFKKTTDVARSMFTETTDDLNSTFREIATPSFIPYPTKDDDLASEGLQDLAHDEDDRTDEEDLTSDT